MNGYYDGALSILEEPAWIGTLQYALSLGLDMYFNDDFKNELLGDFILIG